MDPIYLDYAASTPVRTEVREAMEPYLYETFGNPSSTHRWGRAAQAALEESRASVAEALGVRRREIVFVRGGTESDNLALLGLADRARAEGRRPIVVVSAIEHGAVLEAATAVEASGGRRIVLPVDRAGRVELPALDAALAEDPACVSVMWVNNETGVIQPIEEISARCRAAGVPLHTDAVQAVGKIPVRLDEVPVELLSISGHKLHGPKSAGALVVREGTELHARIHGGGQEAGLRPGTQDVAGVVGLAVALRLALAEQEELRPRLAGLRTRLLGRLRDRIPELRVNGEGAANAGHVLNVGIPGVSPELLMASLDMEGLAVSGGSACDSGGTTASRVIAAMWGEEVWPANVRYSFSRETTEAQIDRAAEITAAVVERLRTHPVPA